jgi:3-hydroxyisobutyrate dehydrogenase-like beta-hydroxyacid dehydrogenase
MGLGMARGLIKAGHEVTVYNRTASKTEALVAEGARFAPTVADACRGESVITMLADDHALESVVFQAPEEDSGNGGVGILASLPKGAIHISSSTISVALAQKLATKHAESGQRFVSAPVFGRPEAAAAAKLFIVVAGAPDAVDTCMPLFEAMGQKTFRFGEKPSSANLVKISGNFMISSTIEMLAEAMALVAKGGLDQHQYLDFLTSSLFTAPIYKTYGTLIADKKFKPAGFAAPLGFKDTRLTLAAGEALRVPLPLANLVRDRFLRLLGRGDETIDWSAISQLAAEDAGLN